MSLPTQFRALASIVEDLEQRGVDVTIEDVGDWEHTDALQADLALELPETINSRETVAVEGDDPDDGPDEDRQSENCGSVADGVQDRADAGDQDGEVGQADGDDEGDDAHLACPEAGCEYTTDSERGLNIHQTKAHGDHDDVWCGVCGDGPFAGKSPLAGHHNGVGHEGDLQPVDEPPADGTTGGGSEDTAPEREFDDVAPDWLDERSFHEAAELCADLEELTTTLGWDDREQLAALVKVTDVDVNVARATGVPDS